MLIDGAKEMPESLAETITNDLLLDEALSALRRYSLIEVKNEKLTIHRLVQAVIRSTIDETAFKQWAGVAVHVGVGPPHTIARQAAPRDHAGASAPSSGAANPSSRAWNRRGASAWSMWPAARDDVQPRAR